VGTKIKIRRADGWDVVRVGRLLERGAREQAKSIWYPQPSKNSARALGTLLALIDQGFVVVAEAFIEEEGKALERRIVGAIGMAFARDGWSDDWCLNNEWLYIHPEWRDTEIADKLLTAVEDFADSQTNPATKEPVTIPIVLGVLTGTDTELKDMLMKRRGYQHGGSNFVRARHVEHEENDADERDTVVAGADQPTSGGDVGTGS
jgi:GNAT superfamily N-acetyltransferase